MSKFAVRASIVAVAAYLILCYAVSTVFGIDIWSQTYYLLFELCLCFCVSAQGKYHCKYIRWTMYGIFLQDCIVCADVYLDFMPCNWFVIVPPAIIALGLLTTLTLAIRHYIKVKKLKKIWRIE